MGQQGCAEAMSDSKESTVRVDKTIRLELGSEIGGLIIILIILFCIVYADSVIRAEDNRCLELGYCEFVEDDNGAPEVRIKPRPKSAGVEL